MKVTASTALHPQVYTRDLAQSWQQEGINGTASDGALLEIATDGVRLDLAGAVLDGENFQGWGIFVHDCSDVVIANGTIKGLFYGIRAEKVRNLTITHCEISDNYNPGGIGWLDDAERPNEDGFGGGIYHREVFDSRLEGNSLSNNFNGIDLARCDRNVVKENDVSYSGNVGIHLLRSSDHTIADNRAEHCIRYTRRFWNDTADSAGILLEEYSHRNRITNNIMRYSGDGFFIGANNRHGCNDNYVARNDGGFSPNNAFEAVFSEGNVFEDNIADSSNYGFWLGFSRKTVVRRNRIRGNRMDGVAIEHGSDNTIEGNEIDGNRNGIRLWADRHPAGADVSEHYLIRGNRIRNSRERAVSCSDTRDVVPEDNIFEDNAKDVVRRRGS